MKAKLLLGLFMIIMIAGLTTALVPPQETGAELLGDGISVSLCDKLLDIAEVGKVMPGFAPFKNEVFDVYDMEGYAVGRVIIEDGTISNSVCEIEADETTTGPASLTFADPDGNMILFDQHR